MSPLLMNLLIYKTISCDYVPNKYQEIFIEFLDAIRYTSNKAESLINNNDLEIAKKYFEILLEND